MNPTVIYHSADFDGIFCREIARKFLPEANLIGWDYGHPGLPFPDDGQVYVLDLSPECFAVVPGPHECQRLIWIDHHKSAIEKWPKEIPGYRIDGVGACRLSWQWFSGFVNTFGNDTPQLEDYKERRLSEPWAVRLAGEYDIWDKRDPNAELFQHGLISRDLESLWPLLLSLDAKLSIREIEALMDVGHTQGLVNPNGTTPNPTVAALLEAGRGIQYAQTRQNESIIKAAGFDIEFEGLKFLACNHARYNSHLFTAGLRPDHDACFGFAWRDGKWTVSLYHAPGKEHHDLSLIATKYGGGGHRGACGFRTDKLPFIH